MERVLNQVLDRLTVELAKPAMRHRIQNKLLNPVFSILHEQTYGIMVKMLSMYVVLILLLVAIIIIMVCKKK